MLPFGSNLNPTTPLLAVFVYQAMVPSASAKTRFPSVPNVRVAFSPTGLPVLASQTQRKSDSDRAKAMHRASV